MSTAGTRVTPEWTAAEVARAFLKAWGKRRPPAYKDSITHDAVGISMKLVHHPALEEMRKRALRCGRAMADEAMRRRVRAFTTLPSSGAVRQCVLRDAEDRIALRLTVGYEPAFDQTVYQMDMLGGR